MRGETVDEALLEPLRGGGVDVSKGEEDFATHHRRVLMIDLASGRHHQWLASDPRDEVICTCVTLGRCMRHRNPRPVRALR